VNSLLLLIPLIGILIGILIGFYIPINLPTAYSAYMSIAILAALDSVLGGLKAYLEKHFDSSIFISGFFGNAILAVILAYLGDRLGVPLYYAAVFAFGVRLFQNFAIVRRYAILKMKQ
jgi:small basic protein